MLKAEDLTENQLIDTLLAIKLPTKEKNRVKRAKVAFQSQGRLPLSEMKWLRGLYARYHKAIKSLYEARERARVSMARRRLGLTAREVERREKERLDELRAQVEDYGI